MSSWVLEDDYRNKIPFAFLREMTEAVTNIGPFRITPGRARTVQTASRPKRYVRRPNVFHPAFCARGTYIDSVS